MFHIHFLEKYMFVQSAVLSFEEFLVFKNNFYLHFVDNFFGDIYRKTEFYKKCHASSAGFRKLERKLLRRFDYETKVYQSLLYQAYLIMRSYVDDDIQLFT